MRYVIVPVYGDRGVLLPRLPEEIVDEIAACSTAVYVSSLGNVSDVTTPGVHVLCITNEAAEDIEVKEDADTLQTEAQP